MNNSIVINQININNNDLEIKYDKDNNISIDTTFETDFKVKGNSGCNITNFSDPSTFNFYFNYLANPITITKEEINSTKILKMANAIFYSDAFSYGTTQDSFAGNEFIYTNNDNIYKYIINPKKDLIDNKFENNLFWGNSINRTGKSVLGKMKNQGTIGSCWAFGLLCPIESYISIQRNLQGKEYNHISLSEQYVNANDSEKTSTVFGSLAQIPLTGCVSEKNCPYLCWWGNPFGENNICSSLSYNISDKNKIIKPKPYTKIPINSTLPINENDITTFNYETDAIKAFCINSPELNIEMLKNILQIYGPLSVLINISENTGFEGSQNNILEMNTTENANHAVSLVGYNTDKDKNSYWIIRNSWGLCDSQEPKYCDNRCNKDSTNISFDKNKNMSGYLDWGDACMPMGINGYYAFKMDENIPINHIFQYIYGIISIDDSIINYDLVNDKSINVSLLYE